MMGRPGEATPGVARLASTNRWRFVASAVAVAALLFNGCAATETEPPVGSLVAEEQPADAAATPQAATPEAPTPQPAPEVVAPDGWQLVWSDEFAGDGIDGEKWAFHTGADGFGNDELQRYTRSLDNVFVAEGELVIQALDAGDEYTSAKLRTLGLASWTYGRFEVRAKMPVGQGIWPAIWMMPEDSAYGPWPASGEIDIVEYLGHDPTTVHTTLHWEGLDGTRELATTASTLPADSAGTDGFAEDYHVFAIEWSPEGLRWLVDDEPVAVVDEWPTTVGAAPAPFDRPFHLIVNLAVGGRWPGDPDATTQFPQQLRVDYVRVFESTALAPFGAGE